jgi:hypothetical protein
MPGHVVHLWNLYCHCLSQPFPSWSFPVHTSHSITRFPAPSLTSHPDSHMLASLRCAHFGTFSALTRGLSAFHLSICPAGGTVGNASFCSFQRAQEHSNLTTFPYCCMSRAEYTNSSRARTDSRMNSVSQLCSIDLSTFRVALLI